MVPYHDVLPPVAMSAPVRVVIVDDEPPARRNLRALLVRLPDVSVVGEAGSVAELERVLARELVDVILLDIAMPGLDGMSWARRRAPPPVVVFVTAHGTPAVDAFDVDAADYLLKPVTADRLARALRRAGERTTGSSGARPTLLVRAGRREIQVRVEAVDWVRARGNYLEFVVDGRRLLYRTTLSRFLELTGDAFLQVHRGVAVRPRVIREVLARGGAHAVRVDDGTVLPASRRRVPALRGLLRRRAFDQDP